MSKAAVWDELTRLEQRALIKLFGGGSLRTTILQWSTNFERGALLMTMAPLRRPACLS
jgi:hypothetical protein